MLEAIDPSNGQVVRRVPALDSWGMNERIERARSAWHDWRMRPFNERGTILRNVASHLRANATSLGRLMTEEMGKPAAEAEGEVLKAAWCAEHYAEFGARYLAREQIESDAARSYVQYLPLGVVLGILPWNAPFWLAFRFCAPALMAGNTCVMKHDPHVPGCAEAIETCFSAAGAPPDILANLPLATADVMGAIRHSAVQAVSFTGSSRAGAAVAAAAAAEIKPAVLELGGSDPNIVLADADLEAAAETLVRSRIINAGQSCIAAKRIIAEAPIHDPLLAQLERRLAKLKVGDPRDPDSDLGPIARDDLRRTLHEQVRRTVDAGARCHLGGEMPHGEGFYYPVTLLSEVTPDMTAACEETFGPVAVVMRAGDADHAIELANSTPYGLGAAVWTGAQRGEHMAERIEAGQVAVNGIVKTDPRLPSGGIKRSGYGRELGPHGIREFVNAQQVWVGPAQS
ncbi:MAG: NAD-dependent succinate-semialdehyde dehydrogenase [Pseudomonadales bacterium]